MITDLIINIVITFGSAWIIACTTWDAMRAFFPRYTCKYPKIKHFMGLND